MSDQHPTRFVCINVAATLTGMSEDAIRARIKRSQWLEGRQYIRRGKRVFIDLRGYEKWVMQGAV